MTALSSPHEVTRLLFDVAQPYEQFRARYEDAVPEPDSQQLAALVQRGARWDWLRLQTYSSATTA